MLTFLLICVIIGDINLTKGKMEIVYKVIISVLAGAVFVLGVGLAYERGHNNGYNEGWNDGRADMEWLCR